MKKLILDACCGSKMMWFDKNNPDVVFGDIREESHTLCDGRDLRISPDVKIDFTNLPFEDNTFKLVAFDPPPTWSNWATILGWPKSMAVYQKPGKLILGKELTNVCVFWILAVRLFLNGMKPKLNFQTY